VVLKEGGVVQVNESTRIAEPPKIGEYIFGVCILLYSSGAFITLLKGSEDLPIGMSTGSLLTNLIWVTGYLLGGFWLIKHCHWDTRLLRQNPWLFALTALPVLSVLWSDAPWITALRAAALIGTTLLGLYLGLRFKSIELLRLLGWSLGIAAVLSCLVAWLIPSYGRGTGVFEGEWIGVFQHKNTLGSVMALGFLVFFMLRRASRTGKWLFWCLCLLSLVLVFLANSVTSEAACVFLASIMFYGAFVRPRVNSPFRRFCIVFFLAATATLQMYLRFDSILNALGRDETLTGRLIIWSLVWPIVQQRFLLGYGYGGFWLGLDGPSEDVWKVFGEQSVYHAHNGYLEIWTGCGLAGVILLILCMIAVLRKAVTRSRNLPIAGNNWPLYLFLFLAFHNLAEPTFLAMNHIFWLVFVAVAIQLSRPEEILVREKRPALHARMEPQFEHA
jgi:exopolysaccharide production protein ExoQ